MQPPSPAKQYAAPSEFLTIVLLFVTGRVMLLLAFPPENLIAYGDYRHYFNLAQLTRQGYYPFIHYWYEFPPIFPYLNIAVYNLAGGRLNNYIPLLALALLLAETGNLVLLHRLARHLHGPHRAVRTVWIYTALFVPVFFWLGNFDALTTFFILLGLVALLESCRGLLAAALGLGAMVKFVPLLLLAAVWRAKGFWAAAGYGLAALLISLIFFAPFAALNPAMTLASLQAQAGKSSYQTVWALIDGNLTTGNFGPIMDHFDPRAAGQPVNNPARLPTWLTFIPFGLLGVWALTRPRRLPELHHDTTIFTAFTFIIFFLWSQGWSPQWQTFLIPLLLLVFPERRAVLLVVVLGFVNFLEWPVILSRGLTQFLPLTIIIRTLIFALLAVELYRQMANRKSQIANSKS